MEAVTEPAETALPPSRRIGLLTMASYGIGAIAYGVKENSFGTFLLLFYNQVLGLPSQSVGLVVMCALLIDAVVDPAIGFLSDRTRSRLGRRHPWMYAAALPIAIGWVLLWHPPTTSHLVTLLWLLGTAVIVRSAISAYEVPSFALTAELTTDYDERTRIMAWRYLFGWLGGLGMLLAAYTLFLPTDAAHPKGLLDPAGYGTMSWVAAAVMAIVILISAAGTHHEIKRLPHQPPHGSLGADRRELLATVNNRGFLIVMASALCLYTNQGISFALSTYLYAHVWRFQTSAYALLAGALFGGAVIAAFVAPKLAHRFGKPPVASAAMFGAVFLLILPFALRLVGLFPPPTSAAMLPILFAIYTFNTACSVSAMIVGSSMIADVVEDAEMRTGKRSEGIFFAGSFFVQKCTSGVGIFLAGAIIWAAGFPTSAKPGTVDPVVIDRLTIIFCASYLILGGSGAYLFGRFPFGRREHEARLRRLAAG